MTQNKGEMRRLLAKIKGYQAHIPNQILSNDFIALCDKALALDSASIPDTNNQELIGKIVSDIKQEALPASQFAPSAQVLGVNYIELAINRHMKGVA